MVLHVASAVARRRVASMATQQIQRRSMGSGPKPEWTGIDKTVRNVFPEDWQLAAAILAGYGSLIGLAVLRNKMKGSPPEEAVVVVDTPVAVSETSSSTGIPPVDSPEFDSYLESKGFLMMLDSDTELDMVANNM